MTITISNFLRKSLLLDAAVSGAAALLMMGGASLLSPLLEIPAQLLMVSGLILVPFVAMLVWVARRSTASRLVLVDIAGLNVLWVAASFGLLASGAIAPNVLGVAFIVAQALAVALFAALQTVGLRQAAAAV